MSVFLTKVVVEIYKYVLNDTFIFLSINKVKTKKPNPGEITAFVSMISAMFYFVYVTNRFKFFVATLKLY